jgi:hypothetical protein
MKELGQTMSEVTQQHLHNLMSKEYMTTVELAACRVPEDAASPVQVGGYVMACTAFYEWVFGFPAH